MELLLHNGHGTQSRVFIIFVAFFPSVEDFTERWVDSKAKSDYGKFTLSAGDFYGDAELDKGKSLITILHIFHGIYEL
jgi:calreticulin